MTHPPAKTTLAADLRQHRRRRGLTQAELATLSGVSVRAICDIERGVTTRPYRSSVELLGDALKLTVQERADLLRLAGLTSTVDPPFLCQLPAELTEFVGRASEVRQLSGLLCDVSRNARLAAVVTITGLPGVGKTALAVHVAHLVRRHFPGGQLYADLRGDCPEPPGTSHMLGRFVRDLGGDPGLGQPAIPELAARYRSLVLGRHVLVLLDDALRAEQVRDLLPGSPGSAVIVTSRSHLPDVDATARLELGMMTRAEALALFTRTVGANRVAAEPQPTEDVLGVCAGLPLAIRLAAARIATRPQWSVNGFAGLLADGRQCLDELRAGDRTVRDAFAVSYESLPRSSSRHGDAAQRAFRLLSLADGPHISLPAAEAVIDAPDDSSGILDVLVDAHLLQSPSAGRYRFHPLLRAYAAERAEAEEDSASRRAASSRLRGWMLHSAAAASAAIDPHRQPLPTGPVPKPAGSLTFSAYGAALAWLDDEHANLLAGVHQAARDNDHQVAWRLPLALRQHFLLRGQIEDWIATFKAGIRSAAELGELAGQAWLLNHLGSAYGLAGRHVQAFECYRQALDIWQHVGDDRLHATLVHNMGISEMMMGQPGEAMGHATAAIDEFVTAGDLDGQGQAVHTSGRILQMTGRLDEAVTRYREAMTLLEAAGNKRGTSEVLISWGQCSLHAGQFGTAVSQAGSAGILARELGDRLGEVKALTIVGHALNRTNKQEEARRRWRRARRLLHGLGDRHAFEPRAFLGLLQPEVEAMQAVEAAGQPLGSGPAGGEPSPQGG